MKISSLLSPTQMACQLEATDKHDAIEKLILLISKNPHIQQLDKVRESIMERERVMSTGVGKGFAIPHGKTNGVSDIVAGFAVLKTPIDFESMDNEPVSLLFVLVAKESMVNMHIKLLSRISRLMNKDDFRQRLIHAQSEQEIYDLFQKEEELYPEI